MLKKHIHALVLGLGLSLYLGGCRGTPSDQPPIHLMQNMDFQSKFEPQEENDFYQDRRAMRPIVAGTVAQGHLKEDDHLYRGWVGNQFAKQLPSEIVLTHQLLKRGQDRFNIYCAVCHDRSGFGNGMAIQRGMVPPTSFHDARLRNESVGYFFHVISEGVRNMASYKGRLPDVKDRWAIAAYVRALQLSQLGQIEDVPEQIAIEKGWK